MISLCWKKAWGIWLGMAAAILVVAGAAQAQKNVSAAEVAPLKALGSKSAPITMQVFSDYQCPACGQLYVDTLRQVMDNYVSAGKVYLVDRKSVV